MKKKLIHSLSAILAVAVLIIFCTLSVSAITDQTLNLANAKKNLRGDGYEWNNPDRILTLTDLSIETDNDFGLKIPDNCTVILKGKNTVKATQFGIGVPGSVVFEGDGSLTVEAGEAAIYNYSYSDNHKMRFGGGNITLKSATPLLADRAEVSVTSGSLELISTADTAANTRVLSISGGEVSASGSLNATHMLYVDRAKINVVSDSTALVSDNILKLENVKLKVAANGNTLANVSEYSGESSIETVPEKKSARNSILFGENIPITVDYILLSVAILLVAAAITLPIVRKRVKVRRLYERLDNERSDKKK